MTIFSFWPSSVTLTFIYLNKCFKWHFYSSRRTTVPNYFEILAQLYKLWPRQSRTDKCTPNTQLTHIHRTKVIPTMSRSHCKQTQQKLIPELSSEHYLRWSSGKMSCIKSNIYYIKRRKGVYKIFKLCWVFMICYFHGNDVTSVQYL